MPAQKVSDVNVSLISFSPVCGFDLKPAAVNVFRMGRIRALQVVHARGCMCEEQISPSIPFIFYAPYTLQKRKKKKKKKKKKIRMKGI